MSWIWIEVGCLHGVAVAAVVAAWCCRHDRVVNRLVHVRHSMLRHCGELLGVLRQALNLIAAAIGAEFKTTANLHIAGIQLTVLLLPIVVGQMDRSVLMSQSNCTWLNDNTLRTSRIVLTVLERSIVETHWVLVIRIRCIVYRRIKAVIAGWATDYFLLLSSRCLIGAAGDWTLVNVLFRVEFLERLAHLFRIEGQRGECCLILIILSHYDRAGRRCKYATCRFHRRYKWLGS